MGWTIKKSCKAARREYGFADRHGGLEALQGSILRLESDGAIRVFNLNHPEIEEVIYVSDEVRAEISEGKTIRPLFMPESF